jgi:hypothetical protein
LGRIKLALGIHNHQPVGNFEFVFENAYQNAYLPFLEIVDKHPKIKLAQHYTGILFEWILQHHPDFVDRLRSFVKQGQIEMMTGGYYEPILINISDEDKFGQIKKLTQFVKNHTGYNPNGFWLAERIWEPQLAQILALANIKYTIIDDSHFKYAGLQESDLYGYYITEDVGYTVNIFPISEKLRYTIPFRDPEETIEYLKSVSTDDGDRLVVFADDGEKFGVWPGTHKHCYQDEWLERFFTALEANLDWIEIVHFSEVLTKLPPIGKVYLPTASYREMMEWALPSKSIHEYEDFEHNLKNSGLFDQYKVYVRGGFWRNFLAKYPESNNLHKKSLYVSKKVNGLKDKIKQESEKKELLEQAYDHLWAGECNCPYWHGVFGGLYLNNLRYAVYKNMIQSEKLIDRLNKNNNEFQNGWTDYKFFDFDADGRNELIVETKTYNLYFAPEIGGTLFELDYKPKEINLLDTMTRREEGYHRKLLAMRNQNSNHSHDVASIHDMVVAKEENLDQYLHYDWYRRGSLIDHFLNPNTTIELVANSQYNEDGDFVLSSYNCETKQHKGRLNIILTRSGKVWVDGVHRTISLQKNIQVLPNGSELLITYRITNLDQVPLKLWFAIEFNFALLAGNAPDRYYYIPGKKIDNPILASKGTHSNVHEMGLKDEWLRIDINLSFNKVTDIWRFPIETISQSEGGFERVYQSSVVFPNWKLNLESKEEWIVSFIHKISEI